MYQQFKNSIFNYNAYNSDSVKKLKKYGIFFILSLVGFLGTLTAMHTIITNNDLRNIVGAGLMLPLFTHAVVQLVGIRMHANSNSWSFKQTFQRMFLRKTTFDFLEFKANMEQIYFVFEKYHQLPLLKNFYNELMHNSVKSETISALNQALLEMPAQVETNDDIQSFEEMAEKFNSKHIPPTRFFP